MGAMIDLPRTLFSWFWPRFGARLDRLGGARHRELLLDGLTGTVVEVGCGDGRMFDRYPASVTSVVALEPDRGLRELAEAAAAAAPVPVSVDDGTAERIPLDDEAADAVLFSLVLCSVPDQAAALAECRRVLRPGGELRFYEHVVASGGALRPLQMALDRSGIWPTFAAGCHLSRDTARAITDAGFTIEQVASFHFPPRLGVPHILGRARLGVPANG